MVDFNYGRSTQVADEAVVRQSDYFASLRELGCMLDALPQLLLILNERRLIVYANRFVAEALQLDDVRQIYGLRPGELLDCPHAFEDRGHCGTTEACQACGANRAIRFCQRGQHDVRECRILQRRTGRALDLRVSATPVKMNGESFTVLALSDIGDEKRRQALERVFFHDLMNVATGIVAYSSVLSRVPDSEHAVEAAQSIRRLVFQLTDEIKAQRELAEAEADELRVERQEVRSRQMLDDVFNAYREHEAARDRTLVIDGGAAEVTFSCDRTLLARILGNMVKNALEAVGPNEQVTLGCTAGDGRVEFSVHNPGEMPREVQLQVFQRSFSTKGRGRGLGTYSIKLLAERYLAGKAWFTSSAEAGTTFHVSFPR